MEIARYLRLALRALAWWVAVTFTAQAVVGLVCLLASAPVPPFNPVSTLTSPLRWLTNFPNVLAAYAPYNEQISTWFYLIAFLSLIGFVWFVAARHDILNPFTMWKETEDLPVVRRLRPRLSHIGIYREHDALRGDPDALRIDKVKVMLRRAIPGMNPTKMPYREDGMLVPFSGPQPTARIYLGTIRQLMWIRRKKFNVYARPGQHVVVFGPSGAGKGVSQMNPSLLMWNGDPAGSLDGFGAGWPGPLITSTVKNDHVDVSLEWRLSLSDQCFIYDPMQLFPEYKDFWVGWSPISQIKNFSDANRVTTALMDSESQQGGGGGNDNTEYFKAQAVIVLSPLMLSAALAGLPFRTVYEWCMSLDTEANDPNVIGEDGTISPDSRMYQAVDPLYEYAEDTGDSTPLDQLQQVFKKADAEASGIWGTIRKILQPYNDEKSVCSTDPAIMPRMLDPEVFFQSPHATLYIIAPQVAGESKRMRPVFAAFITWLIEQAQNEAGKRNGKLPYPVLANLDEVKNVGAIPGLAHTLSLTRSIGFFVKHAWQDEAQIESAYGKDDSKTIVSNSRTWIILPGMSDTTHLEHLSSLLGERKVRRWLIPKKKDQKGGPERVKAGASFMIKELDAAHILVVPDNIPPFIIDANPHYKDKVMASRWRLGDRRRATGAMPDALELRERASRAKPKTEYEMEMELEQEEDESMEAYTPPARVNLPESFAAFDGSSPIIQAPYEPQYPQTPRPAYEPTYEPAYEAPASSRGPYEQPYAPPFERPAAFPPAQDDDFGVYVPPAYVPPPSDLPAAAATPSGDYFAQMRAQLLARQEAARQAAQRGDIDLDESGR